MKVLYNYIQILIFKLKSILNFYTSNKLRHIYYKLSGAKIMKSTIIPKITVNWPHQLQIGERCILEEDLFFKFDGIWQKGPNIIIGNDVFIGKACEFNITKRIIIGNDTLIASGCKFIDHNHGYSEGDVKYRKQPLSSSKIVVGSNVWIGVNTVILPGVIISDNAIVGAGSVVTKSIPSNETWAGVPARKIREIKF